MWLPLNLSERNQPLGVANAICYLFLFSFPSFGHLTISPDQTHPFTSILIKILGNVVERKKLETKAIGPNKALDYLWMRSSLPPINPLESLSAPS